MSQMNNENQLISSVTNLSKLGRAYRHLGRFTEVAVVLVKFGFGDLLVRFGRMDLLNRARDLVGIKSLENNQLSRPERVRLIMEELGVVFIKWGQYLSTRDDLIPKVYIQEFTLLQDSVSSMPLEAMEKALQGIMESGELAFICSGPMAAASVGQVHEARLCDGQKVVVKIRRPGLRKKVTTDLEILAELADLMEKHIPAMASARPKELVEEFSRSLISELDFTSEAVNMERFGRFYAINPKVEVPKIYRSLCSERVLVMEKVEGIKFDDKEALIAAGYDLKDLARFGAEVVLEQIMVFGYFHGDPHPGNLLVRPGPKVALLDFGLVGRLNRQTRDTLLDLTLAVVRRKPKAVTGALLKLLDTQPENPPDRERLEVEVDLFLEANVGRPLKELNIGRILNDVQNIAAQYQLSLPSDLLLLVKAMIQVEGLCLKLNPDFDLVAAARPFIKAQYRLRYNPGYWIKRLNETAIDLKDFLGTLPSDMRPLYNMLRSGHIKSEFSVEGLKELMQTIDRSGYRLSFAVVLASLVIGSSIVIHADMPPRWHGLPVLGLIGFMGAALVGFWLLYDFIRNRRF